VAKSKGTKRKTFLINQDVAYALDTWARDTDKDINLLAEEALRDFLRKHGRPISVEEALRQSVRVIPANDRAPDEKPKGRKRKSRN
jgi:hypothetical protein